MTRRGWPLLAAGVVIYDYRALRTHSSTLSSQFAQAIRNPVARWPVTLSWLYLTAHLFSVLPARYDPLARAAEYITRKAN